MSQPQPPGKKSGDNRNRGRSKYRGRRFDHRRSVSNLTFAELRDYFAACSRCGYFLTSLRVIHGVEALESASQAMKDGWIDLTWNRSTRDLLRDIYGLRTDIEAFHVEAACQDCQRRIIYDRPVEEESTSEPDQSAENGGGLAAPDEVTNAPARSSIQKETLRIWVG